MQRPVKLELSAKCGREHGSPELDSGVIIVGVVGKDLQSYKRPERVL